MINLKITDTISKIVFGKENYEIKKEVEFQKKQIKELSETVDTLSKENKSLSQDAELMRFIRKNGIESVFCYFCQKEYREIGEKFHCTHCEHYFCSFHQVPETHKCPNPPKEGKLKSFREQHFAGGNSRASV